MIRDAVHSDIAAVGNIAEACELFEASMLPEMIEPSLSGADEFWMVAEADGRTAAFAFARPEELTDRVWNLLALGVHPNARGKGLGGTLLRRVEDRLTSARMILIETTQLPDQHAARALYSKSGYEEVAKIPDFYEDGADKIVFVKRMADAA